MPVQNRIVKVAKRNRALVRFDQERISRAILRAAQSIGGFGQDHLPGINDRVFDRAGSEAKLADFLSETVVICLNSEERHLTANFPPTIEAIQDEVLHVLYSYGFQKAGDAYAGYRWGRHWLREGALSVDQFRGNGLPQPLLAASLAWNQSRGCDTMAGLNQIVQQGQLKSLVEDSLARYEQSLDHAARLILSRLNASDPLRLLWITGPSASGKTTTTIKLTERLQRQGLKFLVLNLDDYFWPLVEHPTDWINDRNYERPEALDIELVNTHLRALLQGETIDKPIYDFKEGRHTGTRRVRLEPDQILLLDCLHGLYPPLTEGIPAAAQFRLYVEAQNGLWEGDGSTRRLTQFTDVRLLRRMLRDARHRNHSPLRTLLHWHYVRAGELFSIVPLSGLADDVINGGLPFDLPLLQPFFLGPGGRLPRYEELQPFAGFLDARIRYERVRQLLESVAGLSLEQAMDHGMICGDAMVREFIGGSTLLIPHND